ncbi:MAG: hypothetical protein ACOVOQ_17140 [Flavobacterium sp.]
MENFESTKSNNHFTPDEPQINLFIHEDGEQKINPAVLELERKAKASKKANNSVKVIDGVTPFIEAYCEGIRTGKKEFTINVERVYDENGLLDFIYTLKE